MRRAPIDEALRARVDQCNSFYRRLRVCVVAYYAGRSLYMRSYMRAAVYLCTCIDTATPTTTICLLCPTRIADHYSSLQQNSVRRQRCF